MRSWAAASEASSAAADCDSRPAEQLASFACTAASEVLLRHATLSKATMRPSNSAILSLLQLRASAAISKAACTCCGA